MVKVAILGAGRIAQIHAKSAFLNTQCELKLIADPWKEGVDKLATELNCEAGYDYYEAINRDDIDAVVIATATDLHIDLMLHAVKCKKPVLCEKPIDLDFARSISAVQEIQSRHGQVMLAFNRRFDEDTMAIKNAILNNEIGEIRQVIITSRDPGMPAVEYMKSSGGIFKDMTIHDFDAARHLLGEEPVEIFATASRLVDEKLATINDYDTCSITLKTKSGKQCIINNCREAVYGYDQRIEVLGSQGLLKTQNHRPSTLKKYTRDTTASQQPLLNFFLERYIGSYRTEFDVFVSCLVEKQAFPTNLFDGLQALYLAVCAMESVESNKAIRINPEGPSKYFTV
ncbi:inositol 2-dehydrogenase [Acinetobacter sp. 194]|uniref:inositol 2-dehydrogenase n=1 Tax=Acinetobacter shaoyimingii TaxID=2715164 RepID=UPI00140C310D|nr:inositol 2-dehydrogenase [Acinetobacter shaoyimingii]NHB57866.1 inositol 2-dehydrogenase [Acinetobacter shaoyimingii]